VLAFFLIVPYTRNWEAGGATLPVILLFKQWKWFISVGLRDKKSNTVDLGKNSSNDHQKVFQPLLTPSYFIMKLQTDETDLIFSLKKLFDIDSTYPWNQFKQRKILKREKESEYSERGKRRYVGSHMSTARSHFRMNSCVLCMYSSLLFSSLSHYHYVSWKSLLI
jgi:hypothetical protein